MPWIEERKQWGEITVGTRVLGERKTVPIELTIVDTYHEDGRKDVTIKVPKIMVGAKNPLENKGET